MRGAEADRGPRGRVLVRCRGFFFSGAVVRRESGRVNSIERSPNSKCHQNQNFVIL